jgi:hypothetical protein
VTSVKGKEIFSKRRNEILKAEFQERDRIEILVKREIQNARLRGKTLDYDKVKAEVLERLSKVVYGRQAHPHLIGLGKGVFWIAKGCVAGARTLRYGQEAIRHKRTTSRAARGSLPFIPFAS